MNRSVLLLDRVRFYLGFQLHVAIPLCHQHVHLGHFGHLPAHYHQNFQKLIKIKLKKKRKKKKQNKKSLS